MNVIKKDGTIEKLCLEKWHKFVIWSTEGIDGVSASQIEMQSNMQFYDGITTKDINAITIKATVDLISPKTPNYDLVAGHQLVMDWIKEVHGSFRPTSLYGIIEAGVHDGYYDKNIIEEYSIEEINELNEYMDYSRDMDYTYAMAKTIYDSWTIKNKETGIPVETPQEIYMLIAMATFMREPADRRLETVKKAYDDYSERINGVARVSLPSPTMAGMRTSLKMYSSCATINSGDSKKSLQNANSAIIDLGTVRAGIGLYAGAIRGLGANVGSFTKHTGIVKILQWFETATKAFSQGARGNGANVFIPFWHHEIMRIMLLKSNKLPDDQSARALDYAIGINDLVYERAENNEDMTLFRQNEVRELDNNVNDYAKWLHWYIKYENTNGIYKEKISARDLLERQGVEYFETGRVYPYFIDNLNNGPFKLPIVQSNLCVTLDTLVLTKEKGNIPIGDIVGQRLHAWNGRMWSLTSFYRTGRQSTSRVVLSTGEVINATENHKWYIVENDKVIIKPTYRLAVGDTLEDWDTPDGGHIGSVTVVRKTKETNIVETACGTEPGRHRLMFNNIVTGNCNEITLPTTPLEDGKGRLALCILSNINAGAFDNVEDTEQVLDRLVRGLNNIIDMQEYPNEESEWTTKGGRYLAIGTSDWFHRLARLGLDYRTKEANNEAEIWAEHIQYYLLKSSNQLAIETGEAKRFREESKYADGWMPKNGKFNYIDQEEIHKLSINIVKHGLKNIVLSAIPPAATSAIGAGSTSGIDPVKNLISYDESKSSGIIPRVVPEYKKYAANYVFQNEIDNIKYLNHISKFAEVQDQSISTNIYFSNKDLDNKGKMSSKKIIKTVKHAHKLGFKTLYYCVFDGMEIDADCANCHV